MLKEPIPVIQNNQPSSDGQEDTIAPALVRDELRRIIASRHFRTSRRGMEFLQHVVEEKISGKGDLLKERLIGVQLFGRKPDYPTGEDPVVRVQAGDVRRRLESYNSDPDLHPEILIQIPLGSYAPIFLLRKDIQTYEILAGMPVSSADEVSQTQDALLKEITKPTAHDPSEELSGALRKAAPDKPPEAASKSEWDIRTWRKNKIWSLVVSAVVGVALVLYLVVSYMHRSPEWALKAFWAPAAASTKPVLLCLPKPIVYRPSEKLYDKYEEAHPNAFTTREARRDQVLALAPTDTILWGDITPVRDSGPGIGAVVAAVNIGKLLGEQDIRVELRFGEEATYADMRGAPAVIVGGINTAWETELMSGSHFVFDETRGSPNIYETVGAKRVWRMENKEGNITRDYGLITRQMSGKAGQFLVQVAGISHFGTEAASEFLANKKTFADALNAGSVNLREKNLQIVVSTEITGGRAGPPEVVAISTW